MKHGKRYFGYKNYSGIDAEHKASRRPRRMCMTARRLTTDDLIDPDPTDPGVWVDRAYRNQETEKAPQDAGYEGHICKTVQRDRSLTDKQPANNRTRSKIRSRVEHVFGFQENSNT